MGLTQFLADEGDKHPGLELILLLAIPLILSFILFRFAKFRIDQGAPRWTMWASLVPVVIAIFLAYPAFADISDQSYRDFHSVTPRSTMLHYAAFFTPIAATVALVGYLIFSHYRHRLEG